MKRAAPWWFQSLRQLARFKFTYPGQVAVVLMFLTAVGIIAVEIPVYQFFCCIVGLLISVELTGTLLQPDLKVTGNLPDRITAGDTAVGSVSIENQGYLPACDLMCTLFPLPRGLRHVDDDAVITGLRKGEVRALPISIQGNRRGEYALPDLRVHSTFPFNLMRFGRARLPGGKLIVVPSFHRLEQFNLPLSRRYQPGDSLQEARSGDAPEYVGNRDYVPGEPLRRVDFRAWARVGKPVVREYRDEYCARVSLVLDTYSPRTWKWRQAQESIRLEAAISLTASIADSLNEIDATIDVFAAGPDLYLFQTSSGITHFESVQEILAAVESTHHNPFERLTPVITESLDSTSIVICVLVDWDDARAELTQRIQESGCSLRVILVHENPADKPLPADEWFSCIPPGSIMQGEVRTV